MLSGKKLFMLKKRTLVLYCTLQHTVVRNRSSKQVICKEKKLHYKTVTTVTQKKICSVLTVFEGNSQSFQEFCEI